MVPDQSVVFCHPVSKVTVEVGPSFLAQGGTLSILTLSISLCSGKEEKKKKKGNVDFSLHLKQSVTWACKVLFDGSAVYILLLNGGDLF